MAQQHERTLNAEFGMILNSVLSNFLTLGVNTEVWVLYALSGYPSTISPSILEMKFAALNI